MAPKLEWLVAWTAAFMASCTASRVPMGSEPRDVAAYDSVLFRATLLHLSAAEAVQLRVDPRPIPADPRIVSLHPLETVIPDWAKGQSMSDEAWDRLVVAHRTTVLQQTNTPFTDVWKDRACPGVLTPPSPANLERKRRECPGAPFRSAVMAIPRAGGAYLPNTFDEREKHGADAVTVRVIVRLLSPDGSVESSYDYVYRCANDAECSLVEVKPLLVVE